MYISKTTYSEKMQLKINRFSSIMKDAHSFKKYDNLTIGMALRKAWLMRFKVPNNFNIELDVFNQLRIIFVQNKQQVGSVVIMENGLFNATNMNGVSGVFFDKRAAIYYAINTNNQDKNIKKSSPITLF